MQIFNVPKNMSVQSGEKSITFREEIDWENLQKISILTNDQGPFLPDAAIALFFEDSVWIIDCEHKSYREIYDLVTERFPVDFPKIIDAMKCLENEEFVLWEK